jgi:hypothetical protein
MLIENGEISKGFSNIFFCGNVWENPREKSRKSMEKIRKIFRRFGKIQGKLDFLLNFLIFLNFCFQISVS